MRRFLCVLNNLSLSLSLSPVIDGEKQECGHRSETHRERAGAGGAQLKAADLILCIIKQSHSMQHPLYIIHAQ